MASYLRLLCIALCLCLSSCAINVSPSAFFYQDTNQKPLDTTKLHAAIQQDKTSAGITRVEVKNNQGLMLRGVAVSYPTPMVNVLFFADNRMSISENNSVIHRMGKLPANILWLDYQGVGASEKSNDLSIDAIKQDALTQFDYVKTTFDNTLPTIVHGRGIGSYFASYVAANRQIDALVLDGAFNNISDLIANMVPGFSNAITSMRLHDEVHSMQIAPILRHYDGPLWLVVGEQDKITPYPISQQLLAQSASEAKLISIIPGATHNATLRSDYAISEYRRFLASLRR
ncbi:alpha/beta hydrolase [Alteromonas gracilis]|uniref:alpha/beta hydrolase n=1 Tax=Alteromonas gracilis TaxID=1479524 RepID=UPI00321B3B4F